MRISLFIIISFNFSCSSNHIAYKKADIDSYIEFANVGDVGYFEEKIELNAWRIKYIGLPSSLYKQLESLLKKRSTELCKNGFHLSNYIETGSVVAHRTPVINRYVEAVIKCSPKYNK